MRRRRPGSAGRTSRSARDCSRIFHRADWAFIQSAGCQPATCAATRSQESTTPAPNRCGAGMLRLDRSAAGCRLLWCCRCRAARGQPRPKSEAPLPHMTRASSPRPSTSLLGDAWRRGPGGPHRGPRPHGSLLYPPSFLALADSSRSGGRQPEAERFCARTRTRLLVARERDSVRTARVVRRLIGRRLALRSTPRCHLASQRDRRPARSADHAQVRLSRTLPPGTAHTPDASPALPDP